MREAPRRHRDWLGSTRRATPIVVRLHRTLEDHEDVRRIRFPQGSPGRAFLDRVEGVPTQDRRSAESTIHVAATADAPATSLSHELAHAAIYDVMRWAPPPWLDEGLATYLETPPSGGEPRGARPELEAIVRTSLSSGKALPWRRLFAADRTQFDGADARARYAQAWSVVRFLVERAVAGRSADETLRRRKIAAFLQAASTIVINDETLAAIGDAAGGDLADLERVWAALAAK